MAKSYFSHDSNAKDDPKIIKLIDTLGLEGYGAFWVLIESLRDQPNLRLPIISIPRLSRTYGITQQKLESVIKCFDLFQVDEEYFFSESLLKRMNEASERGREAANKRYGKLQLIDNQGKSDADALHPHAPPMLLKEKKLKEKKLNEIQIPAIDEFLSYCQETIISSGRDYNSLKFHLELKYKSWHQDGWVDGNGKKIVNWKSKINNTIPYLAANTQTQVQGKKLVI